jgi:hypothetical protein
MDGACQAVLNVVYENPEKFVSWPTTSLLLWDGATRVRYHQYPDAIAERLRKAGITPNTLSNGPAICSFLLAGGLRPLRETGEQWPIHHIYDGKFPHSKKADTAIAVRDGRYFTEAGGLVALHPIAHACAHEFSEFAWWLRGEAFRRFKFDPDRVFEQ